MSSTLTESVIEQAALAWLESVGWQVRNGSEIAPGEPESERDDYGQVVLVQRLRNALAGLNPQLPAEALEDAFRKLARPEGAVLIVRNRAIHRLLVEGVTVEYRDAEGIVRGAQARVIDFEDPGGNDWLAVNQFTVVENKHTRRPDLVLFVNGLPLAVVELKNAADESATIWSAFRQVQTYKAEVPSLFEPNELIAVSDGLQARVGTLTAGREWFKPWRTIAGETLADGYLPELQVVIQGLCAQRRFLDLLRDFIVFENDGGHITKKMAGYHQFHAVLVAVGETLRATELQRAGDRLPESARYYEFGTKPGGKLGDRRVGVVWHTQGSGKSLTMVFYAGRIIREPAMENPTLVVLTDRNDLDDQLFGTFSRCQDLLHQPPVKAESRAHLRHLLRVAAGGVVFTTIHKFFPEEKGDRYPTLSERRNIVVIADEAHRSQYDFIDGYARHMRDALPHASFIGFTGTPIELQDANTRAVFGDYISVYDIQRAVQDGATVPIYYESRLAKLALDETERPKIDPEFEEATEGEEVERKEKLKTKWAQLEAVVGAQKRLGLVAKDIVEHFEQRLEAMEGKAMIVCMSRRICVELHREIVKLRPDWDDAEDERGALKVVMTGSAADPAEWQTHIRSKPRREALANRFRDPNDPFKLVLVRDMWLTGPPQRIGTIQTIQRAGGHLLTVINDVLDLSKIEADKICMEKIETHLPSILVEVDSLVRPRIASKRVDLRLVLDTPVPDRIISDPTRLRQILVNLIGNAAKFTQAGHVAVRTRVCRPNGEPKLRIEVEDTGAGMLDQQVALLFQPFTQADSSVTRKHGGTGLGLTISRRLARLMGGDVWLDYTALGRGSRFVLELPLVELPDSFPVSDLKSCSVAQKECLSTPGQKLVGRILLAEDSEDNQQLITFHLANAGADVEVAENGKIALEMLKTADEENRPFDLLVTDIQMPEMDGYTLVKTLRARGSRVPIVALTAHAMAEERQKCLDAGCDAHATKPINKATLISTCAQWLENSRKNFVDPGRDPVASNLKSDSQESGDEPLFSEFANDPKMAPLIHSFLSKLEPKVTRMTEFLIDNRLDELARLAHQLSGTGGGYGFPAISNAARSVEHHATTDQNLEQIQQAVSELSLLCRHAMAANTDSVRAAASPLGMEHSS